MKTRFLTLLCAAVAIAGSAGADRFLTFKLPDAEGDVTVCVGTEASPTKYGGFVTRDREATVLVPALSGADTEREVLQITISTPDKYGRAPALDDEISFEWSEQKDSMCGPDTAIEAMEYIDQFSRVTEELAPQIAERLSDKDIGLDLIKKMNAENTLQLTSAYKASNISAVIPTMTVSDAFAAILERQERQRKTEKLKQFIEDFARAAETYAEQRDARRRKLAREQRERQEAAWRRREAEAAARAESDGGELAFPAQYCFGAIGSNCGKFSWDGIEFSTCHPNLLNGFHTCTINAGSWTHDQCCVLNPDGYYCDGPITSNSECKSEFDLGSARFGGPFTWTRRDIDSRKENTTGRVVHDDYCALSGSLMPESEKGYCCSRDVRKLNRVEKGVLFGIYGFWVFDDERRVCKSK
jgi:hypothetical protein